ncbi:MAG: glycosyltransferase family 2 protein, partial [Thermoflexales bacterium]
TAVVIVTWNGEQHVSACLKSLTAQTLLPQSVVVVDNDSADQTLRIIASFQAQLEKIGVRLVITRNEHNRGFTCAANQGIQYVMSQLTQTDIVILLNQDTAAYPTWLEALHNAFLHHTDAGALGCKIFYPGGATLQHAGGVLVWPRLVGEHYGHHESDAPEFNREREVDFVTGAAMALRATALQQIGLFNEIFSPGYYEDVDLCLRLKAHGWRVLYMPRAVLEHAESASFSDPVERLALSARNRLLLALSYMKRPNFQHEFASAELDFLRHHAHPVERRALSLAYGRAMLMAKQASSHQMLSSATVEEAIETFARLRRECIRLNSQAS